MISYHKWLNLTLVTRNKIADVFKIPKRGGIEVNSNEVKSDGFFIGDIEELLTVKNMQKFLKTKEKDPHVLWDLLVYTIENPIDVTENEKENTKKD